LPRRNHWHCPVENREMGLIDFPPGIGGRIPSVNTAALMAGKPGMLLRLCVMRKSYRVRHYATPAHQAQRPIHSMKNVPG